MGILSRDTTPEAERVQFDIYRRMPESRRLAVLAGAVAAARRLRGEEPSAMQPDVFETLDEVFTVLDRLGVDYVVGGSVASTLYGEPRYTQDADVIVRLRSDHVEPLAAAVEERFYVSRQALEEAVERKSCANLVHFDSGFKVDLMVSEERAFEASRFARRRRAAVGGRSFWVSTAEDTLLAKLEWYRLGGEVSDRQWRDVLGIMLASPALDQDYLDLWSGRLGVGDLLDRARQAVAGG